MAAPPPVCDFLELAARRVLEMEDRAFFIDDSPMGPVFPSIYPKIELWKIGGTTGHREQGHKYIHYQLRIIAANIRYSIYIMPAADDAALNQQALARAIRWFINNYNNGSTFTRDESAI